MASVKCPSCGAEVQPEDLVCVTCGANLTRGESAEPDQPSPPTIMHERIRLEDMRSAAPPGPPETCLACGAPVRRPGSGICPRCGRPLRYPPTVTSLVILRLSFSTGNVDVPAGTSLTLGRDPEESLVAAAFARFEDVSRRHATVTVYDSGRATIRDEYSTNGTFVRGDRVLPGTDVALADGDTLRLAAEASARVHLPSSARTPDSLNGPADDS
jgi:FHA domain/Double zinc ribbon